jgi:DNA-binding HxlR family transcriptional regulator
VATIRLADMCLDGARVHGMPVGVPCDAVRETYVESLHLRRALDVLRQRWRAEVVWCLRGGAMRFNAVLAALSPISHKVLTEQLRALERAGVVARELGSAGGRHVEYRLTPLGADLPPILERLGAWGAAREHMAREHSTCTTCLHDVTAASRANGAQRRRSRPDS